MGLHLLRDLEEPETTIWLLVDAVPVATIFLEEAPGKGTDYPEWCLSFCDSRWMAPKSVAHVFDGPAYESLEQAVPRILEELLRRDFPEAPDDSAALKAAVLRAEEGELQAPD